MSRFNSKEFKAELAHWRKKLKTKGFKDIEDEKGFLKGPNRRTVAFDNRDSIRHWFLTLDCLMNHYKGMPRFERQVMEYYTKGISIVEIAKKMPKVSRTRIKDCIKRYKHLVLAIILMLEADQSAHSSEPSSNQAPEVTANAEDRIQNKAA